MYVQDMEGHANEIQRAIGELVATLLELDDDVLNGVYNIDPESDAPLDSAITNLRAIALDGASP